MCIRDRTRGLGFNENTRLLFLLSRPICAEISQSIFEIARLSSHIQRDMSDIDKVLQVFLERGVFSTSSRRLVSLYWISWRLKCKCRQDTRVYGWPTGLELSFSQKRLVKTLASAAHVKTSTGERIEIDPKYLYQRLLIMGVGQIPLVWSTPKRTMLFPRVSFDNQLFMRSGDKAELIHHLVKPVSYTHLTLPTKLEV